MPKSFLQPWLAIAALGPRALGLWDGSQQTWIESDLSLLQVPAGQDAP